MILERFIPGAGWFEIAVISIYGGYVAFKMQDPINVPRWRRITWITFSIVFFTQLILGLSGLDKFLMTGKLHLPIPMMILAGPLYRGQTSIMTLLFLSTVILSGPAWCSQLCYFGAFDSLASRGKTQRWRVEKQNHHKIYPIVIDNRYHNSFTLVQCAGILGNPPGCGFWNWRNCDN